MFGTVTSLLGFAVSRDETTVVGWFDVTRSYLPLLLRKESIRDKQSSYAISRDSEGMGC